MNSYQHASSDQSALVDTGHARHEVARASGALSFILGSLILGTIGVFVHEADAHPVTLTWFRCAFGLLGLTVCDAASRAIAACALAPARMGLGADGRRADGRELSFVLCCH